MSPVPFLKWVEPFICTWIIKLGCISVLWGPCFYLTLSPAPQTTFFLLKAAAPVTDSEAVEIMPALLQSREASSVTLFVSCLSQAVHEYASLSHWRKILPRKKNSCLVFKKNIWTGKMHCTMKDSSNLQTHELMSGISFHPYLYVTAMAPTYDKSLLAEFWKSNSSAVNIK